MLFLYRIIDIAAPLYRTCPVKLSAVDRHLFIFISYEAAGKFQFHADVAVFPIKRIIPACILHAPAVPAHILKPAGQRQAVEQLSAEAGQLCLFLFLFRRAVDCPLHLFNGLYHLIIRKLLLPCSQALFLQFDGMHKADGPCLRQLIYFLIHGIKASVFHIAEGGLQCFVLIDAPDQSDGKLMHDRIFYKQFLPLRHLPQAFCTHGLFQPKLLVGNHRLQLLLQEPVSVACRLCLLRFVLFAGCRQILKPFPVPVIDLQLQRRRQKHLKFSGPVVKDLLHLLIKSQIRYNAVLQLRLCDAKLIRRTGQGVSRSRFHLTEFEFSGDLVYQKKCGRAAV